MRASARARANAAVLWVAAVCAAGGAFGVHAQDYPQRPIRWLVPFAPGGINDIIGRWIAQRLSDRLGQQVVVDNRGGGGGIIAAETAARSAPDGYTVLQTNAGPHGINPSLYPKLPYDAIRDFAPITQLVTTPMILVVPANSPARTVKDLIAVARSKDGLNYASTGIGSTPHLTTEYFKTRTGAKLEHVPYKGAAPAFLDMMSGHIAAQFTTLTSAQAHVAAGRVRVLGVCGSRRLDLLPDVPTMAEAGLPNFEIAIWNGLLAPARTAPAIIGRLHAEVVAVLQHPEVRQRIQSTGSEPVGSAPESFGRYIRAEIAAWGEIVRRSGAKASP